MTGFNKPIHLPCPECDGSRAIVIERLPTTDTVYCPDCGNTWSIDRTKPPTDEASAPNDPHELISPALKALEKSRGLIDMNKQAIRRLEHAITRSEKAITATFKLLDKDKPRPDHSDQTSPESTDHTSGSIASAQAVNKLTFR